jgi:hypothetical protein
VVDQFRYLGVTLTYNLTWGPHINRMLAVASRRASAVRSMVHSYNVAEAWLARTAAYCIMAPILEFASAIWAHGPHVEHGTKTAMASMQRQWDMVVRSANGVHRHASVLSLRGDMGLWSLRGRWDYMRLQYHFRLALQPADSWLTKVATLGRQMTAPVQSGAHKDTWHYASERLLVKYGIERGAMGAYRDTPAFLESVGVSSVAGAKALARDLVQKFEEGQWRAQVQDTPRFARVYHRLGHDMSFAPYLSGPNWWGRVLRARLRAGELRFLGEVSGRYGPGRRAFADRGPCAMCGHAGVESTEHFLLHCPHWQRHRHTLWGTVRAAPDIVRCPAVWRVIQRAVADATVPANSDILLRLLLEGDLSDAMPDGYGSSPRDDDLSADEVMTAEAHRAISAAVTRHLTTVVAARKRAYVAAGTGGRAGARATTAT